MATPARAATAVVGAPAELAAVLADNRGLLETLLAEHGAVLFRGFGGTLPESFPAVAAAAADLIDYVYRSTPRTDLGAKIYTSTEYPPDQSIPPHCEASYQRDWPMKLIFGCQIAAESGGETPLSDVVAVTAAIDPAVREEFARRGVLYVRHYGEGIDLPWQTVFQTGSRAGVERVCAEQGIEAEWLGDVLRTRQVCQGMAEHPITGHVVWFNQAQLFHVSSLDPDLREALLALAGEERLPRHAYFGDGGAIPEAMLDHVRDAFAASTISFPWQASDVLVLDNMLVAHARRPYRGPRRILTAMGDPYSRVVAAARKRRAEVAV